jgi:phosphohistidine swiveling domain-containing protein
MLLQARQVTSLDALPKMLPGERSVRFWWLDFDAMWQFVAGAQSFNAYPDVPANRMSQVLYVREKQSSRCLISVDDALRLTELGSTLLDDATYRPFRAQVVDCLEQARALSRDLAALAPASLSIPALTAHLVNVQNVYQRCVSWYRMFDPYMTGAIVRRLACHLTTEDIGELLQPLGDERSLELADWAKLVAKEFSEETALAHVSAYPWLVCNEYTRASILTSLREKHRQSKHLIVRTAVPACVDMSRFPADVRNAAIILRELSSLRIQLKMAFTSFDFHFVELYDAVSKMSRVPVRNLHEDYSIDDMVRLLHEGKPAPGTSLRIIEYRDGRLSVFEVEAARQFLAGLNVSLDREAPAEGRLAGTVAFHGTVTGCVRVVNCNDVVKTNKVRRVMQQGDILVSEMIQLNIMDLVQRAGGLITDEGGMLSHAAILARELRIPCIVGTQRATQMLKDGDRVEIKSDQACIELVLENAALR